MRLYRCKAGQVADPFPLPKGGWGRSVSPKDGLVFGLDSFEQDNKGFFVGDEELSKVGYYDLKPVIESYMKLFKKQLQLVARELELSERGTKKQIIKRILGLNI